ETVEQRPERGGRPSQHCDREVQVEIHRSEGVPRELPPCAHDDRYHQHLHEPVTGMDGGELPRDVLPEDRSREQDHREPDPQGEAEGTAPIQLLMSSSATKRAITQARTRHRTNSMSSFPAGIFAPTIAASGSMPRSRIHGLKNNSGLYQSQPSTNTATAATRTAR